MENQFTNQARWHSCCLTGHRQLPREFEKLEQIRQNLRKTIASLVQEDITIFYAGGARGFDTLAAMTVLEMKVYFPQIRLYLALPYPEQAKQWTRREQQLYEQIKEHADDVQVLCPQYTSDCMKKRNYYMVEHSCVCAFYLEHQVRSGTAQTVNYARRRDCRMIDLLEEQPALLPQTKEEELVKWEEKVYVREIYSDDAT